MNRREMLQRTGASALALGLSTFPLGWTAAADGQRRRVLMYTRSVSFEHPVVKRKGNQLSLAERILTSLGKENGFDVVCTKDGRTFSGGDLDKYDAFFFQTQGDLTREGGDGQPPMTPDGKKALLQAIADGKGFAGCHCASDTFHSRGDSFHEQSIEKRDPYIAMVGGEFIRHGAQQKAWMRVVDRAFPGTREVEDFQLYEEWYSLKNFAPDLHVILVEDNEGMRGLEYQRPSFPATWARMHHKGRVFYTSMGHREDVWQNPTYQKILLGGLSWAMGNVTADVTPNIDTAAPKAHQMPTATK
jgi:type 1 glutamine amidotransferase